MLLAASPFRPSFVACVPRNPFPLTHTGGGVVRRGRRRAAGAGGRLRRPAWWQLLCMTARQLHRRDDLMPLCSLSVLHRMYLFTASFHILLIAWFPSAGRGFSSSSVLSAAICNSAAQLVGSKMALRRLQADHAGDAGTPAPAQAEGCPHEALLPPALSHGYRHTLAWLAGGGCV